MTQINVPQYYPQLDSRTQHADRMCFSSTVAMAIKFLKPDALLGSNADDDYLRTVLKYGDTTNPAAQQQAVREYGLDSRFTKSASWSDLERILKEGRPVPVGWLHHGPPSAPRGGGHWSLLTGITGTHTIHHDPYGEADMVKGGYVKRNTWSGKNVRYTILRWRPRWAWGGEGWLLDVFDPNAGAKPPAAGAYKGTWESVEAIAREKGARFPELVAAQWALESDWGRKPSGKYNFFGVKGTPGTMRTTQEWENGRFVTRKYSFRDYDSPEAGIADLIRLWYKDYKHFTGINHATTVEAAAQMLRSEGYATDPEYPAKLIRLIRGAQQ